MSVGGGAASYESKGLTLKRSWNQDIDPRPIHGSASSIYPRRRKLMCETCPVGLHRLLVQRYVYYAILTNFDVFSLSKGSSLYDTFIYA